MKYITFNERKILEKMKKYENASNRKIGKVIKKSHTTIAYELKKNKPPGKQYSAEEAHKLFLLRQVNKGNKKKIDRNKKLKNFIIKKLIIEDMSPEFIAARLKGRFKNKDIGYASHETIYKFIYDKENKHLKLYKSLLRHKPKRTKWYSRKTKKTLIPERVSIHERPHIINKRQRFGDWETDSMIFSKQKEILSVQVERSLRLVRLHICKNKTSDETYEALVKTKENFPDYAFHSYTFDNGTENVKHIELKKHWDIETYFCDPYSSWQKGTVENMNMFIRRYLPRHTKLSDITKKQLYEIQEKLNNRPRKCLGYLTPNEKLKILKETGEI